MSIIREVAAGTQSLRVKSVKKDSPLVVVIPGNPGLCDYYDLFLYELSQRLPGCEIVCSSQLGFDGTLDTVQSLDIQVAHQRAVIAHYLDGNNSRPVIVLGHSVGGWLTQRVAVKTPQVKFAGLLAPTVLDIASSDRGKVLSSVSKYSIGRNLCLLVAYMLTLVPIRASRLIVNYMLKGCSSSAITASIRLITRFAALRQVLVMSYEEMVRIASPPEPSDIEGFWSGKNFAVYALFAQSDHWVSPESSRRLLQLNRPERVVLEVCDDPSMAHSWCLRSSDIVAEHVATALRTASII